MHKDAQSTTSTSTNTCQPVENSTPSTPQPEVKTDPENAATDKPQTEPYSWKSILLSVVSAAFGVQSQKNRERDFAQGRLIHFIVGGCLFVASFVGFIYLMVQLALRWN